MKLNSVLVWELQHKAWCSQTYIFHSVRTKMKMHLLSDWENVWTHNTPLCKTQSFLICLMGSVIWPVATMNGTIPSSPSSPSTLTAPLVLQRLLASLWLIPMATDVRYTEWISTRPEQMHFISYKTMRGQPVLKQMSPKSKRNTLINFLNACSCSSCEGFIQWFTPFRTELYSILIK